MDPLACWERLIDAALAGEMAEAADAARDLDNWRRRGGFRPDSIPEDVWRMGTLRAFAQVAQVASRIAKGR